MENNPYEPPGGLEKLPQEKSKKPRRSDATVCLTVSGILLFLIGFLAATPGGYWGMFLMAFIFGTLGLLRAETRMKRVIGGLLAVLSFAGVVLDLIERKRHEERFQKRLEELNRRNSSPK